MCTISREEMAVVRFVYKRGASLWEWQSPALHIVTTWIFSYILRVSFRDPWWHQVKSSCQWSTASAKGKRGPCPSLEGTPVIPAGHPQAHGTADWRCHQRCHWGTHGSHFYLHILVEREKFPLPSPKGLSQVVIQSEDLAEAIRERLGEALVP